MAAGDKGDPCVARALEYLLQHQNEDGSWDESEFTGTGFPRVFYLKYHQYRNMFPVYALSHYRNLLEGRNEYHGVAVNPADFPYRSN
jgi:squalene-hopene/tetraprenyl-beta-curcumene cyclase